MCFAIFDFQRKTKLFGEVSAKWSELSKRLVATCCNLCLLCAVSILANALPSLHALFFLCEADVRFDAGVCSMLAPRSLSAPPALRVALPAVRIYVRLVSETLHGHG